jgi:hypothetical protein
MHYIRGFEVYKKKHPALDVLYKGSRILSVGTAVGSGISLAVGYATNNPELTDASWKILVGSGAYLALTQVGQEGSKLRRLLGHKNSSGLKIDLEDRL